MKKRVVLSVFIALFLGINFLNAQGNSKELNNYKYVVVPLQFSFQNEENEYLLNSWLKHLLNQHNFETVIDKKTEFPPDLIANNCLGLYADVNSEAEGLFSMQTKLVVQLKNCVREVVYETKVGTSRSKDFAEGYKEALKDAMDSFYEVDYAYNGKEIQGVQRMGTTEKREEAVEEKPKEVNALDLTLNKTYAQDGEIFGIRKIQAGYLLLNENTGERIALLNQTENGILYSSDKIDGTVSIKEDGNLLSVEYFDKEAGGLKKLIYKVE